MAEEERKLTLGSVTIWGPTTSEARCSIFEDLGSSARIRLRAPTIHLRAHSTLVAFWDGIEELANAWHGVAPWNADADENYLDEYLLSGVERPTTARLAARPELEALDVERPEWR